MKLWMVPFFVFWAVIHWLFEVLETLAPVIAVAIGAVSIVAAVLSALVLALACTRLLRARRPWVRVVGWVLVGVETVAVLGFLGVGVIAIATAVAVS